MLLCANPNEKPTRPAVRPLAVTVSVMVSPSFTCKPAVPGSRSPLSLAAEKETVPGGGPSSSRMVMVIIVVATVTTSDMLVSSAEMARMMVSSSSAMLSSTMVMSLLSESLVGRRIEAGTR